MAVHALCTSGAYLVHQFFMENREKLTFPHGLPPAVEMG
jgi:hypothetical protein